MSYCSCDTGVRWSCSIVETVSTRFRRVRTQGNGLRFKGSRRSGILYALWVHRGHHSVHTHDFIWELRMAEGSANGLARNGIAKTDGITPPRVANEFYFAYMMSVDETLGIDRRTKQSVNPIPPSSAAQLTPSSGSTHDQKRCGGCGIQLCCIASHIGASWVMEVRH